MNEWLLHYWQIWYTDVLTKKEIRQRSEIWVLLLGTGYKVCIVFTEIWRHNKEHHWIVTSLTHHYLLVLYMKFNGFTYTDKDSRIPIKLHSAHAWSMRVTTNQCQIICYANYKVYIFLTTDDLIWTEKHLLLPSAAAIIYMTESELQTANLKMIHAWI